MRKSRKRVSRKRKSSSRKRVPLERRRVSRKRQSRHRTRRKSIKKHIRYRVGDAGEYWNNERLEAYFNQYRSQPRPPTTVCRDRSQYINRLRRRSRRQQKEMADLKLRQETEMRELHAELDRKNAEELAALKQFLKNRD